MRMFFDGARLRHLRMAAAIPLALAASFGIATTARANPAPTRTAVTSEVFVTSTAVAPNADGRMTMFAVDSGHAVWARTQVSAGSDTWSGWSLFATELTTLVAQTNGNGLIEVFGTYSDGKLWHRWQSAPNSGNWSTWELFSTGLSDAPSAISVTAAANGGLTLFALDTSGQIWGWTQYIGSNGGNGGGSWSPPGLLDGRLSTIAAQTNGNGLIELFGVNSSGRTWHRWEVTHNAGNWAPWQSFRASRYPSLSMITATTMGPGGAVVVFGTDRSAGIWGITAYIGPNGSNGGGSWSPWGQMDGALNGITAISYPDRRIQLFGVDGAGLLYQRKELTAGTGSWTPWETVTRPMG